MGRIPHLSPNQQH